ncbi:MAG: pantoate--beta-alanine ligase [Vulcanimicrobiota bacterium]
MQLVESLSDLRSQRAKLPGPVGFVPTMGYLHPGHLSLVEQARRECASVVVSIFVNPTQFGEAADLEHYPRDLAGDLALLEGHTDLVWAPTAAVMYPPGFQTWVEVEQVSQPLEGAQRPGHFRGVATVVAKLFLAVGPQLAYFGQKDAQQVKVIERMVADLNFPLEIRVGATAREPDGLAMSSRNARLTPAERRVAPVLYQALQTASQLFPAPAEELRACVRQVVATQPSVALEYVSCADRSSLEELDGPVESCLLSLAARLGAVRLIDNIELCC